MKKHQYLLALMAATSSHSATLFVDENNFCAGNLPCYTAIQTAVVNATPDSEIRVFPGTYAEQVDLSLMGAAIGPATDGNIQFITLSDDGEPLPLTAEVAPATGIGFTHTLPVFNGHIEIDGFRITSTNDDGIDFDLVNGNISIRNVTANNNFSDGVDVEVGAGGFTIEITNTITNSNGSSGINLDGPDGTIIRINDFQGNLNVGEGIDVDGDLDTDALAVTITNATTNNNGNVMQESAGSVIISQGTTRISNLVSNENFGPGLVLINEAQSDVTDSRFERNGTVTGYDGILLLDPGTVTVNRSFFVDNGASGIWATNINPGPVIDLNVSCSDFSGQPVGIDLRPSLADDTSFSFTNNNFSGHTMAAVLAGVNSTNIDASNNWWNAVSGPTHALNVGGGGEQILDVNDSQTSGALGTVAYAPFLLAPVNTAVVPADTIFRDGFDNLACPNTP